jgi:hypothetical protein
VQVEKRLEVVARERAQAQPLGHERERQAEREHYSADELAGFSVFEAPSPEEELPLSPEDELPPSEEDEEPSPEPPRFFPAFW